MNKKLLSSLTYGLFVCSAIDGERPVGCIINTAMQAASEPQLFVFSLNRRNYTREVLARSGRFALNILNEDAPAALFGTFGFTSGRDTDKFAGFEHDLIEGLPVLKRHTCGALLFQLRELQELGTHTLIVAELTGAAEGEGGAPMSYAYYHRELKGRSPRSAPTYMEAATVEADAATSGRAICTVCGYEHEGAVDTLAEDFRCPICGVGRDLFKNG